MKEDKKLVIKCLRLEPSVASLIDFAAAAEGLTFSDFARKTLIKSILNKKDFLKSRAKQLVETLNYFEKSQDQDYIEEAKKSMRLYPMQGASLDYYIALEKAKYATYSLVSKGFEKSYSEEICRRYFTSSLSERQIFLKALESFVDEERKQPLGWHYEFARKYILGLEGEDE